MTAVSRPPNHPFAWMAALLVLIPMLGWCAGFGWFLYAANRVVPPPDHADGIVALTGGADRIEMALRLLAEGRAPVLLLSGIGGGAALPELASRAGLQAGPLESRVTLGRRAATTLGNAAETAAWVRKNNVRSLIVVTAGYHMPRALTELGRTLPDIVLYPVAVIPSVLQQPRSFHELRMLRLMAEEYTKWLITRSGLSALVPHHEPVMPEEGSLETGPSQVSVRARPG